MIHLDNNATTRPSPAVIDAMTHALSHAWHNPSSVHRAGQDARRVVELARAQVAALVNVRPRCVTFVSGGTESIDLSIRGVLSRVRDPERPPRVITSAIEHSAVRELLTDLRDRGEIELLHLPMDAQGVVDAARAVRELRGTPAALMSVQWANNETGAIQPVAALTILARELGAAMHVDATQWIGKEPADLSPMDPASPSQTGGAPGGAMLDADLVTFSPHKFHGPKGVGALYVRRNVRVTPQTYGGPQERERRGGTENVPAIVGFGVAAELARASLAGDCLVRGTALRDHFEEAVAGATGGLIHARHAPRLWNTTNIGFTKLEAEAILLLLSERGVFASAGAACSSGSLDPSPVLLAMDIAPEVAHGSIRFSLSRETTAAECDEAARRVIAAIARLRASTSAAIG